jgi:O-antigen/teichoic acid export membrane protein
MARETALVFLSNIVAAAGGMIYWFLAAQLLTPYIIGIATAGTTMAIFLAGVGQLGLGIGIIRFSDKLGPRRARHLGTIFTITVIASCVAGMCFWTLSVARIPSFLPLFTSIYHGLLFVSSCVFWSVSTQYDNYLISRRWMGLLAIKSVLTACLRPVLLVMVHQPSVSALVGITGVSGLMGVVAILPFVVRKQAPVSSISPSIVPLREFLAYSFWSYLSGLISGMPALVMPAIIVSRIGADQAAAYYMAWTVFSALLFLPSAFGWVLFARYSRTAHTTGERRTPMWMYAKQMMLLAWVGFIPLALIVLRVLGPVYLHNGWPALVVLLIGFWPYYRVQVLFAQLRVTDSQWKLTTAYALGQLANVCVSIPLLTFVGTAGGAMGWTIGQVLLLVLCCLLAYKHPKKVIA